MIRLAVFFCNLVDVGCWLNVGCHIILVSVLMVSPLWVFVQDKWKTLVHTARISPQQRRGEPVPQELLDRVLTAHAYWTQQQAKQQFKQQPETCLLLWETGVTCFAKPTDWFSEGLTNYYYYYFPFFPLYFGYVKSCERNRSMKVYLCNMLLRSSHWFFSGVWREAWRL